MTESDADILARVRAEFGSTSPARLGVAVSGGGDSVALLHILSRCFDPGSTELFAVTVDHGLRQGAAQEARDVATLAARLGISHTTLQWCGWDGAGNLQDKAREARYQLISDWAKANALAIFALGHTADDQAETLLMRLARSSGVNGLAGMPVRRTHFGTNLIRPLLRLTRAELRDYLRLHKVDWVEDPSNSDSRFDRIKFRQALKVLEPLGVTAQALSNVAQNMAQAREALDWYSFLAARDFARVNGGDVVFDLRQFRTLPDEIARRLIVQAIKWISGSTYAPRRGPTTQALAAVRAGQTVTLSGCQVVRHDQKIWICREYNAVHKTTGPVGEMWDRRWRILGTVEPGLEVRALGRSGLIECPDWRATGRPQTALIASPAVWRGTDLLAAPLAGHSNAWRVQLANGEEEFFASLLSH